MNKNFNKSMILALTVCGAGFSHAQVTLSAMNTFGGGDGWLAPAEYASFGTDLTRGMAYNAATGNLVVVSRVGGSNIRVLNGISGSELGTMNNAGITGGTFTASNVSVTVDGQIFVTNLTSSVSPTASNSQFSIYRFSAEDATGTSGAASTLVFRNSATAGNTLISGARLGDSFDANGFGSNVSLLAGYGANTTIVGTNGVARFDQTGAGTFNSTSYTTLGSPTANSGAFRLGLSWFDDNSFLGSQGSEQTGTAPSRMRYVGFSGGSANLSGTNPVILTTGAERLMDVMEIGGVKFMATADTIDNRVRVYNMSNPNAPVLIATNGTNTSITTATANVANGNGVGAVRWGKFTGSVTGGYDGTLYVMNANNGIQAYNVNVVPEPATMTALGLGIAAMLRRRKAAK